MSTKKAPWGYCRFEELPAWYRQLFETGQADRGANHFFPASHGWASLTLFFGFVPGLLLLALPLVGLGSLLYQFIIDPAGFLSALTNPINLLVGLLIGAALLYVGRWGVFLVLEPIAALKEQKREQQGKHHFGLRLDNKALVARRFDLSAKNRHCWYIPKDRVEEAFGRPLPFSGGRRTFQLRVIYTDDSEQLRSADFDASDFETEKPLLARVQVMEMARVIMAWAGKKVKEPQALMR